MKIDDFYRNVARINLNGSILALIPAIFIVGGNFVFLQNNQIMLLVIPFLIYSIINFQLYKENEAGINN
jgi:ACR3 family arsenite efflux pump ArsB